MLTIKNGNRNHKKNLALFLVLIINIGRSIMGNVLKIQETAKNIADVASFLPR
jgi:hypothetical protein